MKQNYTFFADGTVEFDDSRSVRELLAYAFEKFDYYEPFGMAAVTVFQAHHPDTNTGWFTTDTEACCADEIKNPAELCFAYHMPGVFYYAEGGWGHHMPHLGNHPEIPAAVSLHLRFEDFDHTVVLNGNYSFRRFLTMLQRIGYVPDEVSRILVQLIGCPKGNYFIPADDPLLDVSLTEFVQEIRSRSDRIQEERHEFVYHEIFRIE